MHRDIDEIYAAIDERVANGEITAEVAIHHKEQVRDVACRNSPIVDYEADNNGSIEKTRAIEVLHRFIIILFRQNEKYGVTVSIVKSVQNNSQKSGSSKLWNARKCY